MFGLICVVTRFALRYSNFLQPFAEKQSRSYCAAASLPILNDHGSRQLIMDGVVGLGENSPEEGGDVGYV